MRTGNKGTVGHFTCRSGMAEAISVKFCAQVGYIKSYQKNEKSPPKGAWLWSRDLVPPMISLSRLKLETLESSNFVHWFAR